MLRAKLSRPNLGAHVLERPHLIRALIEHGDCALTMVVADAGYGKTTLLYQWEREVDFPCYWYKLDRNDRDWTLHVSYLAESIAKRHRRNNAAAIGFPCVRNTRPAKSGSLVQSPRNPPTVSASPDRGRRLGVLLATS